MAQKSKGMRRKTRRKLSKKSGHVGTISRHLQDFEEGQQVVIKVDPSIHKGMPHPRFHGRTGVVQEKRGQSFVVTVKDGGKEKEFTIHPAHLKPQNQ